MACSELSADPATSVYIGDDERDVQAGKAAGMATIAAEYGYIVAEEDPAAWGADARIGYAGEILQWLS